MPQQPPVTVAGRRGHNSAVAGINRLCQRVIGIGEGRGQCPLEATWMGTLHVGRDLYVVESCDRHRSGLIDAEPLDGNWERR
ncbi:MAG TPA: hypothetical protein VL984_04335 [Acidimicrobiales bacterium]|nr:hypothetical protein [Acidimicrobiales bacterium]